MKVSAMNWRESAPLVIMRAELRFCALSLPVVVGHGREYLFITLKTHMGHGGCVRCETSAVQQAVPYGGLSLCSAVQQQQQC